MELFLRGLLIGFSIAAPVGPIGVLCIRRTLADGLVVGLLTGLGSRKRRCCLRRIAGYGLTVVTAFLVGQQIWIRLVGLFLIYLGLRIFMTTPSNQAAQANSGSLLRAYTSTFFLTITNPITILSFAAIFAGLGLGSVENDFISATITVLGVFLGSAAWWLFLSGGVSLFRERISFRVMGWVNRASGIIILGFGIGAILSTIQGFGLV
jgi:threonine/homoserine/homoserine lactone efflux protein